MVSKRIAVKICGMRDPANIEKVASLKPDYLGFILYRGSPRFVGLPEAKRLAASLPSSVRKVAVLVDEPLERSVQIAQCGAFDLLQLHGQEDPDYCMELSQIIEVIKAFPVSGRLPENLEEYETCCKMFLFDTAGNCPGGNGMKFNHRILENYSLEKGFLIGGGITAKDAEYIKSIRAERMIGVDLNSRFETEPGVKDFKLLEYFISNLRMS